MTFSNAFFSSRLQLITFSILFFFLTGCTDRVTQDNSRSDEMPFSGKEGSIVINNSGSNAYVVTEISGEGIKADVNESNVTITLTLGGRYTFENESGASSHPLNFRDTEGSKLLGQSNDDGKYSENSQVNVVMEGNDMTFTLAPDLADEIVDYICSFHPTMKGEITVEE